MKNLINKVLVVLTVSALFAGSINASQVVKKPKKTTKAAPAPVAAEESTEEQIALTNLYRKGATREEAGYSMDARKNDIATLKGAANQYKAVKDYSALVKHIEAAATASTFEKKQELFKQNGIDACHTLLVAFRNNDVKEAKKELDANPASEDAIVNLKQKEEVLKATVAETDKTSEGNKSYMTVRNAALATLGAAALATSVYISVYGVPAALMPYVSSATKKMSDLYTYAGDTRLGKLAGRVGSAIWSFGPAQTAAGIGALYTGTKGYFSGAKTVTTP
jgi:hypothetical protein